jgi:hypothetical protein
MQAFYFIFSEIVLASLLSLLVKINCYKFPFFSAHLLMPADICGSSTIKIQLKEIKVPVTKVKDHLLYKQIDLGLSCLKKFCNDK